MPRKIADKVVEAIKQFRQDGGSDENESKDEPENAENTNNANETDSGNES